MADKKISFNGTWSLAVGGMVGGGIFSVLGVIIETAGQWAWLSFLIAGVIALISAHSYSQLSVKYNEGGGAFLFLRKIDYKGFAGSLSWILVMGYILTLSVYAFTFGEYVAHVFDAGGWLSRVLAVSVIAVFAAINLRGVGKSTTVEIVIVYGKLLVLLALAVWGLMDWNPEKLTEGINPKPWHLAIVGAATIFMAFEGFELLSFDYEDLENPKTTLPKASILAVIAVIFIYIIVALGTTMVVGAQAIVAQKEVALSVAGQKLLGLVGLIIVTIAAAFSTGSAINATLFSSARLMESVAKKKDLPHLFAKENSHKIPLYAILIISGAAGVLAIIGNLGSLVDAASIIFLFTFGVVNFLAFRQGVKLKILCLLGSIACAAAIVADVILQFEKIPYAICGLAVICAGIFIFRPVLLKKMNEG